MLLNVLLSLINRKEIFIIKFLPLEIMQQEDLESDNSKSLIPKVKYPMTMMLRGFSSAQVLAIFLTRFHN